MRHVDFDPAQLDGEERAWWMQWSAKVAKATQAALDDVAAGRQPPAWRSGVWSELKQWLLEHVFERKCAYCEINVSGGFFGDAEHYRPKGKVTVKENGETRAVERDGKPHPGYYWLAYHWQNLLPSCELCNSSDGKMNQFPVTNGHVFDPQEGLEPDELDEVERPLLLHPYRDAPSEHLRFGVKGVVAARNGSTLGQTSIEVYDLSREPLETERGRLQEQALAGFVLATLHLLEPGGASIDEAMESYIGRHAPFSQAVRDYLIERRNDLMDKLGGAFGQ